MVPHCAWQLRTAGVVGYDGPGDDHPPGEWKEDHHALKSGARVFIPCGNAMPGTRRVRPGPLLHHSRSSRSQRLEACVQVVEALRRDDQDIRKLRLPRPDDFQADRVDLKVTSAIPYATDS